MPNTICWFVSFCDLDACCSDFIGGGERLRQYRLHQGVSHRSRRAVTSTVPLLFTAMTGTHITEMVDRRLSGKCLPPMADAAIGCFYDMRTGPVHKREPVQLRHYKEQRQ